MKTYIGDHFDGLILCATADFSRLRGVLELELAQLATSDATRQRDLDVPPAWGWLRNFSGRNAESQRSRDYMDSDKA